MSELADAAIFANKILDRQNADPDDDLAILSRQFLRAREQSDRYKRELELRDKCDGNISKAALESLQAEVKKLQHIVDFHEECASGVKAWLEMHKEKHKEKLKKLEAERDYYKHELEREIERAYHSKRKAYKESKT